MQATLKSDIDERQFWFGIHAGKSFRLIRPSILPSGYWEAILLFPEGERHIPINFIESIKEDGILSLNVEYLSKPKPKKISSDKNNGGSTSYYDLPLPQAERILFLINSPNLSAEEKVKEILSLCPQTINDLIEFKNMMPWQHEVIKSCYAIKERAKKGEGSEERELNKQVYYINRRRKQLGLPVYKLED